MQDDGRPVSKFGKLLGYKFIVYCPNCRKPQGYKPRSDRIKSKTKKTCIFCRKEFRIKPHIIKEGEWGSKPIDNKKIKEIQDQNKR